MQQFTQVMKRMIQILMIKEVRQIIMLTIKYTVMRLEKLQQKVSKNRHGTQTILTFLEAAFRSSIAVVLIGTASVLDFSTSVVIMVVAVPMVGSDQPWCRRV